MSLAENDKRVRETDIYTSNGDEIKRDRLRVM